MTNSNIQLFLGFNGLILAAGILLYPIHWSLAAVCILAVALMLLSFVAGWNVGFYDSQRATRREGRRIPVNGRQVGEVVIGRAKETT